MIESYVKEIFERIASLESKVQVLSMANFSMIGAIMLGFGGIIIKKVFNGKKEK